MKSYAIVIKHNAVSETAFGKLIKSSNIGIERYNAVTPDRVEELMTKLMLKWNYPWTGQVIDFATGLTKSAYQTANPESRIACALSHYMLWKECSHQTEPYLILEHDAEFMQLLTEDAIEQFKQSPALIASINSPLGATRKATLYHTKLRQVTGDLVPVPEIDDMKIPQGLPGNSAYMIKPTGAQSLVDLVANFGLWPNDAIMCKQLIHGLYCFTTYYTRVQGTPSTTTL